tara:strand:- start:122 stop:280 length:159 start_codon:yes stop_codon:yes gene_type:complete
MLKEDTITDKKGNGRTLLEVTKMDTEKMKEVFLTNSQVKALDLLLNEVKNEM